MTRHSHRLVPSWVEADSSRERVLDALGLAGQANRIADDLLPDLSVLTRRARYLSFLAWAADRFAKESSPEKLIHRHEAELAVEEAKRHEDAASCPAVVGRVRARRYFDQHGAWPARPEQLYRTTAWSAYRPLMRAVGILAPKGRVVVTKTGRRLADIYRSTRAGTKGCLSDISSSRTEQSEIRKLLGFDGRTAPSKAAERRRATLKMLKDHANAGAAFGAASFLGRFAQPPQRRTNTYQVRFDLHRAYVWQLLSAGLNLAFVMLLHLREVRSVAQGLRGALQRKPRPPSLNTALAPDDDHTAAGDVVALLRAALRAYTSHLQLEGEPFDLAARLIERREPTEFVHLLARRHQYTKGIEAWCHLGSRGDLHVNVPTVLLPKVARPMSYRLDAFHQLSMDLELIR